MLVLSRYVNESIIIGKDITITIVRVYDNGKVRIGITAPDDVAIDRVEVRNSKDRNPHHEDQDIRARTGFGSAKITDYKRKGIP